MSKIYSVDLSCVIAQPSCIHGNSFCAQTKMAEEEKSAVVRATLTLVNVILVTTARVGGHGREDS